MVNPDSRAEVELWDVLDRDGTPTGRLVARGSPLEPGDFHLVVHVWIVNEAGEYLVQRRALHLDSAPGSWATTGGCVLAGESSEAAVVREVMEELGLDVSRAERLLLGRLPNRSHLEDIWLVEAGEAEIGAVSIGPEVMDSRWVSGAALKRMVEEGEFFPYSYVRDILAEPRRGSLTPPT